VRQIINDLCSERGEVL